MLDGSVNVVEGHGYEKRMRRKKVKRMLGGEGCILYGELEKGAMDRVLGV